MVVTVSCVSYPSREWRLQIISNTRWKSFPSLLFPTPVLSAQPQPLVLLLAVPVLVSARRFHFTSAIAGRDLAAARRSPGNTTLHPSESWCLGIILPWELANLFPLELPWCRLLTSQGNHMPVMGHILGMWVRKDRCLKLSPDPWTGPQESVFLPLLP